MGISEMEKMSGESQLGGVNFRINFSHPCKFILVYIPSFCSSNSHTLHLHHFQIFFKNFMQRYVQYWWSEQLKVLKVSDLDLSHDLEITIPHFAYTIIWENLFEIFFLLNFVQFIKCVMIFLTLTFINIDRIFLLFL